MSVVTSSAWNVIDANLSRAIDASAGGTYSPRLPIDITNGGGGGLGVVDLIGTMTARAVASTIGKVVVAVGGVMRLGAAADIPDTNNQTIDPTRGFFQRFADPVTAQRDHNLVASGTSGRLVYVVRNANGANSIIIHAGAGFAGGAIVTLPANTWASALIYDNGTAWHLLATKGGTPGASA